MHNQRRMAQHINIWIECKHLEMVDAIYHVAIDLNNAAETSRFRASDSITHHNPVVPVHHGVALAEFDIVICVLGDTCQERTLHLIEAQQAQFASKIRRPSLYVFYNPELGRDPFDLDGKDQVTSILRKVGTTNVKNIQRKIRARLKKWRKSLNASCCILNKLTV
jgi:hypothetical protein